MGVGQRGPPVSSATGCCQPNQALELTAPNAGVVALRGVVAWGRSSPRAFGGAFKLAWHVFCPSCPCPSTGSDRGT
jgi:hypothetical protein